MGVLAYMQDEARPTQDMGALLGDANPKTPAVPEPGVPAVPDPPSVPEPPSPPSAPVAEPPVADADQPPPTAVVVAVFFLLSLFFTPAMTSVPLMATAPALIVVGTMMMGGARGLDWSRIDEAVPAFLTAVTMPFTYSIANGITFGIVSYVAIKLLLGRFRDVHPLMLVLSVLLVAWRAFGA